MKTSRLI